MSEILQHEQFPKSVKRFSDKNCDENKQLEQISDSIESHSAHGQNYDLREEIKAYWSQRAASFDLSPWHDVVNEEEREAWHALIIRHLGQGEGRRALDLASGTGIISLLMDDVGFQVTGLDWSQNMLDLARSKAKKQGRTINFMLGDAQNTMEPDASFDVIINRHLVWTLVDPKAAFAEWFRVLKPGGKVLIVDGFFTGSFWHERLARKLISILKKMHLAHLPEDNKSPEDREKFDEILSQVYFSHGATAQEVSHLLGEAGFLPAVIDADLHAIYRIKARKISRLGTLAYSTKRRFALVAQKPVG